MKLETLKMPKFKKTVIIKNKQGLHARPAAVFVQTANKFVSEIIVKKGKRKVNGKSIMGIMMLAAGYGAKIDLSVNGEDAENAIETLAQLLIKDK